MANNNLKILSEALDKLEVNTTQEEIDSEWELIRTRLDVLREEEINLMIGNLQECVGKCYNEIFDETEEGCKFYKILDVIEDTKRNTQYVKLLYVNTSERWTCVGIDEDSYPFSFMTKEISESYFQEKLEYAKAQINKQIG